MRLAFEERKRKQEESNIRQTCTFKPRIRSPFRASRRTKEVPPPDCSSTAQKSTTRLKISDKPEKEANQPSRSKSRGVPLRDDPLRDRLLRDRNERPLPTRDSGRTPLLSVRSTKSNIGSLRNSLERASLPSNLFFDKKSPTGVQTEQRAPSRPR